jgi:hypothetical protein
VKAALGTKTEPEPDVTRFVTGNNPLTSGSLPVTSGSAALDVFGAATTGPGNPEDVFGAPPPAQVRVRYGYGTG